MDYESYFNAKVRKQLKFMPKVFEKKVDKLEEDYKKKHKDDFNEDKMKRYVNRKLKREIKILNYCNIMPSIEILKNSESIKYY